MTACDHCGFRPVSWRGFAFDLDVPIAVASCDVCVEFLRRTLTVELVPVEVDG